MFVGVPPLYKLEVGRKSQYCYDEAELAAATADLAPGSYHVQRFKVRRRRGRGAGRGAGWAAPGEASCPRATRRWSLCPDACFPPPLAPAQGLGEMMPQQLWDTTLNPATRTLRKLTIDDAGGCCGGGGAVVGSCMARPVEPAAHSTELPPPHRARPPSRPTPRNLRTAAEASHMFTLLMGDKVAPRRQLIERHGSRLALEELDI